eukprot:1010112_1
MSTRDNENPQSPHRRQRQRQKQTPQSPAPLRRSNRLREQRPELAMTEALVARLDAIEAKATEATTKITALEATVIRQKDELERQSNDFKEQEALLIEANNNVVVTNRKLTEQKTRLDAQQKRLDETSNDLTDLNRVHGATKDNATEYIRKIKAAQRVNHFEDAFANKEYKKIELAVDDDGAVQDPSYKQKTLWNKILTDFEPKLSRTCQTPNWCRQFEDECEVNEIPWEYRLRNLTTVMMEKTLKKEYIRERKEIFDIVINDPEPADKEDKAIWRYKRICNWLYPTRTAYKEILTAEKAIEKWKPSKKRLDEAIKSLKTKVNEYKEVINFATNTNTNREKIHIPDEIKLVAKFIRKMNDKELDKEVQRIGYDLTLKTIQIICNRIEELRERRGR